MQRSESHSVAKPVSDSSADPAQIKVAFYNIGWKSSTVSGKRFMTTHHQDLTLDVFKAFEMHKVDALFLSELGEIDVGLAHVFERHLYPGVRRADEEYLRKLVEPLRARILGATFEVSCVNHYAAIIRTDVLEIVEEIDVVDELNWNQPFRRAQRAKLKILGCEGEPIVTVVNCHSPASAKHPLNATARQNIIHRLVEVCGGSRWKSCCQNDYRRRFEHWGYRSQRRFCSI